MDRKKITGYIVELIGIVSLLCAAVVIILSATDTRHIILLTAFGAVGITFLISGIFLTRSPSPVMDK